MAPSSMPPRVPFSKAIAVTPLDAHTYAAHLEPQLCIGTVPNGGYVASTLLSAARQYLAPRSQPDTLAAHFSFLNRTSSGPAYIVVEDTKPGRTLSFVHVTLYQDGLLDHAPWVTPGVSRKCLVAYVTNADLAKEQGLSLQDFSLPRPPPPVDLAALETGGDAHWERMTMPDHGFGRIKALSNMEYYVPKAGQASRSSVDLWIRLADRTGGGFTNASLGYVADCWPYVVEAWRPPYPQDEPFRFNQVFWFPTVALNLEVKKHLPEAGVEWLFMRVAARQIKNGRLDLEVTVMDRDGELVALSQHVNLILDGARNAAGRKPAGVFGKL